MGARIVPLIIHGCWIEEGGVLFSEQENEDRWMCSHTMWSNLLADPWRARSQITFEHKEDHMVDATSKKCTQDVAAIQAADLWIKKGGVPYKYHASKRQSSPLERHDVQDVNKKRHAHRGYSGRASTGVKDMAHSTRPPRQR